MGLVLKGIGKGSMFGHGRFLGVHNPFGSALGKASDPYINWLTLGRLTHHANDAVRETAIRQFSRRIELGGIDWHIVVDYLKHPVTSIKIAALTFLANKYHDTQIKDITNRLSRNQDFIAALKLSEIDEVTLQRGLALLPHVPGSIRTVVGILSARRHSFNDAIAVLMKIGFERKEIDEALNPHESPATNRHIECRD